MDATASGTLTDVLTLQHGFRPTPNGPIGVRHGLPVRIAIERAPQRNNQKVLRLSIGTADLPTAEAAVQAIQQDKKTLPAKLYAAQVVEGGIIVDLPAKLDKDGADGLTALDAVTERVARVPGAAPQAAEGAQLTTVDGVPWWLTASDREAIEAQARADADAYAAIKPNVAGGLIAAGVGALVLGIAWALLLAYAEYQIWAIAIGGGLLISFLAVKVGRRAVLPLQVGIFAFTLFGVLFGEILGLALAIQRVFGEFDLGLAFEAYTEFMSEEPTDVLFALGGGLIGAFFGIKAASKPTFDRSVEVH